MLLHACVLFVTLLLSNFNLSKCEVEIGCFVPGECLQSLYTSRINTGTPEECLEHCQVLKANDIQHSTNTI